MFGFSWLVGFALSLDRAENIKLDPGDEKKGEKVNNTVADIVLAHWLRAEPVVLGSVLLKIN